MKPESMLPALEELATNLGVRVSYEKLRAGFGMGGLCRVKGEYRVIIDRRATAHDRVAMLARSLARLDASRGFPVTSPEGAADRDPGTEPDFEIDPKVRDLLRQYNMRRAS